MALGNVKLDEIHLEVLQDATIPFDWKTHIVDQLLNGKGSNITYAHIKFYLEYIITNSLYDPENNLPHKAYIFQESVIRMEKTLSHGIKYTWKEVECNVVDDAFPTKKFILAVPHVRDLNKWSPQRAIQYFIQSEFDAGMNYAADMNYTFSGKFFTWEGPYSSMRTLFNMIYLKDIGFPCMIMPKCLGLQAELSDHNLRIKRGYNSMPNIWCTTPYLLDINLFIHKGHVGDGASGTCKFLEVNKSAALPKCAFLFKKKFVAKEIKIFQEEASYSDSNSSMISSLPRTQLLNEACALIWMGSLKNANIVKPCRLEIRDFLNPNLISSQPFIVFENEGDEQRLFATMEYVEGKDISRIPIRNLREDTKLLIVLKVAEALSIIHENGYIHKDLHLGNIRLTEETNDVKIIDLGCCEKLNEQNFIKDINSLVKIIFHLYEIDRSCQPDYVHANVPPVLTPFVLDRVANPFKNSQYKSMRDILKSFSQFCNGIVLERRFLDFEFYILQDFQYSTYLEEFSRSCCNYSNLPNDVIHSSADVDIVNSFAEIELLQMELEKKFNEEQDEKLLTQKAIVLSLL